ncbi:hypothetical protein LZ554_007459 [Drepanopeziza brunnea f. sp. 'monogermtubi']|nr:hypothetical protein LZ554_007459 [Drepanopeziza brunnea f. sp. 'monogermtubi']
MTGKLGRGRGSWDVLPSVPSVLCIKPPAWRLGVTDLVKEIVEVLPQMSSRDSGKPSSRRPPYFHSKFDIELPEARQGERGRSGPKDPVGGRPGANKQQDGKLFSP